MILHKFLLICFAGCLSWSSLAQNQQPGALSISSGVGVISNNYLKHARKNALNRNTDAENLNYQSFPLVWQAHISLRIQSEIRLVGIYTFETISSEKYHQGILLGAQYLYPVSNVFRVYGTLALGFRFLHAEKNTIHFGYSTTTAGIQFGRQFYVDLGFGGGMSGLLALKIGWLMPPLKSKTLRK